MNIMIETGIDEISPENKLKYLSKYKNKLLKYIITITYKTENMPEEFVKGRTIKECRKQIFSVFYLLSYIYIINFYISKCFDNIKNYKRKV